MFSQKFKKRAIVFCFSANHCFAVGTAIQNLKNNDDLKNLDILLFTNNIKKRNLSALNKIHEVKIMNSKIRLTRQEQLSPSIRQFTSNVLSKLNCVDLLNTYDQVLLLDYDLVFQKSISNIFDNEEDDLVFVEGGVKVRDQFLEPIDNYDMEMEGMHAGIVLFNKTSQNQDLMFAFIRSSIKAYLPKLLMPEQAILDLLIQEYELKTTKLRSEEWACHPNLPSSTTARVLHSYGQPKFWSGLENFIWQSNYTTWLNLGGDKYRKLSLRKKIVNRIRFYSLGIQARVEKYFY